MQLNQASNHASTNEFQLTFIDCYKNVLSLPYYQEETCTQRLLCPQFPFLPQPKGGHIVFFQYLKECTAVVLQF